MLGLFEIDGHYEQFITQGAKKYCYTEWKKLSKIKNENGEIKKDVNIQKIENDKALLLKITVAGVPKQRLYGIKKYI